MLTLYVVPTSNHGVSRTHGSLHFPRDPRSLVRHANFAAKSTKKAFPSAEHFEFADLKRESLSLELESMQSSKLISVGLALGVGVGVGLVETLNMPSLVHT